MGSPSGEQGKFIAVGCHHRQDAQQHHHYQTPSRSPQSIPYQPPSLRFISDLPLKTPFSIRPPAERLEGFGDPKLLLDLFLGFGYAKKGFCRGAAVAEERR